MTLSSICVQGYDGFNSQAGKWDSTDHVSMHRHLNSNVNSGNKVELLVKFIKKNNHSVLMEIVSYQVLRAYYGAYHPAIIHSYAYNHTGLIDGVIVWYPFCDVLSTDGKQHGRKGPNPC